MEIRMLLEDYESKNMRLQEVMVLIEELVKEIPMAEKLLEIKGGNDPYPVLFLTFFEFHLIP